MKIDDFQIRLIRIKFSSAINNFFLFMILISLIQITEERRGNHYTFLTSMQSTNETFIAYIPFIESCSYDHPNVSPGKFTNFTAGAIDIFEYYQFAQKIAFWSSIQNGLDIYMLQDQLLAGYNGIIYRPQVYNADLQYISQNSTNDIVTLFQTQEDGSLIFHSVQVYIDKLNNFTIEWTIVKEQNVSISNQLKNLIQNCMKAKSQIVISQLDTQNYIGLCKNTSELFFIQPTQNQTGTILPLPAQSYSMPINNMILNPTLEIYGIDQIGWNVFLLTNGSKETYSCQFDPLTPQNFTCLNSQSLGKQFYQLLQKLWSMEGTIQQIRLQKLISHIGPNGTEQFPGKINSIFIDPNDNIYIESITNDSITYLNIYDWQKVQIMNMSFQGSVLLYNQLELLVQLPSQTGYSIMNFQLPMLSFNMSDVDENNSFRIELTCSDDVENLVIEYNLFISNISYPQVFAFQTATPDLYSSKNIYTFQLEDYFTVFGPGYTVYYRGPDTLQTTLLDASIISMGAYILSIVELIISQSAANSIFRSTAVTYTTQNQIYTYSSTKGHVKVISNPCDIAYQLKGIIISATETLYYGYLDQYQPQIQYCICPKNVHQYNKCQKISKFKVRAKILRQTQNMSDKIQKLTKLQLLQSSYNSQSKTCNGPTCIRNRLFTMVNSNLIVTIYNNGSAILSNFTSKEYLDQVYIQCDQPNSLDGGIYVTQFHEPSLLLFCYESPLIHQYRVRSYSFLFHRMIPIYGFKIRTDHSNIQVGSHFVFIQVQVDEDAITTLNIDPLNPKCCVLRIDPYFETISVIEEVIFARSIQQVYQYSGIDVAYYQGSQITNDDSFLKIYLDETWFALNQTSTSTSITSYNFSVVFSSVNYNIASEFPVNIVYNMTSVGFSQLSEPLSSEIYLQPIGPIEEPNAYKADVRFDYNGIQGPILQTSINSSDLPQMIQDILLNDIIVQTKIYGTVGNEYLQVFTPLNGNTNTTFDDSIIFISSNTLELYLKNYDQQEMFQVAILTLKYSNCKYYPYKIINYTTIEFVTQCAVPEYNLKTPVLNLTLIISKNQQPKLIPHFILDNVNVQLSGLKTLLQKNNLTLVIGIDEGPMQSLTGKLKYCSSQGYCSDLYISYKQYFLLYYDAFIYGQKQFIIVTLDFQYVQVWVNPPPPNNSFIYCDYIIDLTMYINEDCSIITLIGADQQSFRAVLSGTEAYYEIVYYYQSGELKIVSTYQRYGDCQQFDMFQVDVGLDETDGSVVALVAQCNQNQNTLRLQMFQRINTTTSVVVYTGYLQYFTRQGPVSYFATKDVPSYNPIHILQLSTSMLNKLFMIYLTPTTPPAIKLIYQQIDGILTENILSLDPSLSILLSPLTTDVNFPTLNFTISNNFYSLNYLINTKLQPKRSLQTIEIAFLGVFVGCNLFNIFVMMVYYICYRPKNSVKKEERQSIAAQSWGEDEHSPTAFRDFKFKFKQRITGLTRNSGRRSQYQRQVERRKHTQIQLFSRRSERGTFFSLGKTQRQRTD